jgi:hypothetical protein
MMLSCFLTAGQQQQQQTTNHYLFCLSRGGASILFFPGSAELQMSCTLLLMYVRYPDTDVGVRIFRPIIGMARVKF